MLEVIFVFGGFFGTIYLYWLVIQALRTCIRKHRRA